MASVSYYLNEAERCRALAASSRDADMVRRWRGLAADYEKLADSLAADEVVPIQRVVTQQPMQQQQQQSKTEPEGEK